jgi:hypothetical protein
MPQARRCCSEARGDDRQVHNAIAFVRNAAAREEGKEIFRRIEEYAIFSEHVRKTCETVKLMMMESKP